MQIGQTKQTNKNVQLKHSCTVAPRVYDVHHVYVDL